MTVYTPRGLRIRLPANYCFALMARLYPDVTPFRVLKTAEGLSQLSSSLVLVAAMVCFAFRADPIVIAGATLVAGILGSAVTAKGLYVVPGIVGLATGYSCISGFGIILVLQASVAIFTTGWQGLLAMYAGAWVSGMVNFLLMLIRARATFLASGQRVTPSELNFADAYLLHAKAIGKPLSLQAEDWELRPVNWRPVFNDLRAFWPDVAERVEP